VGDLHGNRRYTGHVLLIDDVGNRFTVVSRQHGLFVSYRVYEDKILEVETAKTSGGIAGIKGYGGLENVGRRSVESGYSRTISSGTCLLLSDGHYALGIRIFL